MSSFLQFLEQQITSFLLHPLLFSFLPFFCFILFLFKWFSTPTTNKNLPPSPLKLPVLGNLHQLGMLPHRSLQSLAQRYGPLMLLHLGSTPALIVSSADAAREIMKTNDSNFSNRPKSSIAKRLSYDNNDVAFAPYGEYWRHMRSICVLQLLSNKKVQSFRAIREEETALMMEKIKRLCNSFSSSPINLSETFALLTNDVVCRVALGKKYSGGEGGRKFKEMLGGYMELLGVFNVGDYIPWLGWVNCINGLNAKVDKLTKEFDSFLDEVVQEHMDGQKRDKGINDYVEDEQQKDFVDVLLGVEKDSITGFSIDRVNIKALISDMFAAGTDTTYTLLEWEMTELLRHPKVLKHLQNEVKEIVKGRKEISEDDLENMHYLKAVIQETLRLHPPLPLLVPRESMEDVKVMGYDIAGGTTVFINAWAMGRDPVSWDEPNEFRPERFLGTLKNLKGQDFQLIPFGAGRRGCPGAVFSKAINELALANLVHKFDWTLPGGARGEDLDVTECTGITAHRKYPLLAVATPRSL